MWVYPRPQFWFEQLVVNHYQDHLWREHFRVSRDTFEYICGLVGPQLIRQNTILRQAITVEKRVAVALWRLATGNSYRTVGLTFGIGRCTAMNVKDEFCSALIRRANDFIKFPKTEAETRQAMQEFLNISRFPQVVGALDGSHIPIKAPKDDPNEYVNRKSFHSIVLQGVADANGKFLHVSYWLRWKYSRCSRATNERIAHCNRKWRYFAFPNASDRWHRSKATSCC